MLTRALSWSAFSSITGVLTQVALMAVLSRLLGPAEFGLMASAMLAMRFVSVFAQFGLGPALIQRKELEPGHQSAAMLAALALGIACWVAFVGLAYPFAAFFREQELRHILMVSPAGILLGSLASVPQSLLRRELRFKALAAVDLFSLVFGYGAVGITLALLGHGVWSLVFATLAQQAFVLVGASWMARIKPFVAMQRRHFTDLFSYGARYSLNGFLEFVSSNVETMFAGRVLGAEKLGFYNRAQAVTSLPVEQVMGAASRVMFPAYSGMRSSDGKLREGVLLSIHLSTLLTLPMACGMSVAADNLVLTMLGPKWQPAVDVARISAWCIPSLYIGLFSGAALDTLARFRGKTVLIVSITLFKIAMMASLARFGLVGIAASMVIAEWTRAFAMVALVGPHLNIRMRDFVVRLRHGAFVALLVGATIALAGEAVRVLLPEAHTGVGLVAQVVAGGIVFFGAAWYSLRHVVGFYPGDILDLGNLRRLARMKPASA